MSLDNKTDEAANMQRFCFMAKTNIDSIFETRPGERHRGSAGVSEPLSWNIGVI